MKYIFIVILLSANIGYGQEINGFGEYELGKSTLYDLINNHPKWQDESITHKLLENIEYIHPAGRFCKVSMEDAIAYELRESSINGIEFGNVKLWYYKGVLYQIDILDCPAEFIEAFQKKYGKGHLIKEYYNNYKSIYNNSITYAEINHNGGANIIMEYQKITKEMHETYVKEISKIHANDIKSSNELLDMKNGLGHKNSLADTPIIYDYEKTSIIKLSSPIDWNILSKETNTDTSVLKRWNPYYDLFLQGAYPEGYYLLHIPLDKTSIFIQHKAKMEQETAEYLGM